ncbi:hypothetical protein D4764_0289900 [Takifugu flavidus]|uniref:Uncharacterized protein n=1 Tax=Takifugu flavidus TaxID=433684 RepID=A0A5C6MIS0_9TELE|nr:hypothetical protein D4764_0289900 [Takifugu flavidus]
MFPSTGRYHVQGHEEVVEIGGEGIMRATISSDGKKALKQLREKPSRQRSEYKTQKALHGIYRGITCLAIRREAEARYTRLLGAEAEDVGEAEAEGEEEAISVKKISVIIVKIMDTGNVIAERNNVTRDTIEDSSKVLIHLSND